jgi:hypothetical protein
MSFKTPSISSIFKEYLTYYKEDIWQLHQGTTFPLRRAINVLVDAVQQQ